MNNKLRPIILAGGSGSRLWPLSTDEKPKQFIALFEEYSLFDLTLQRFNEKSLFKKPIIVTSDIYIDFVNDSLLLNKIEAETIILEPEAKNTCPAITMAVMLAFQDDASENFIVSPSDHYISSDNKFYDACDLSIRAIEGNELILMGIKPERPSIEYGYISTENSNLDFKKVLGFIEKPDLAKSETLISQSNVYWNAGIFIFNGFRFLNQLKKINNTMHSQLSDIVRSKPLNANQFSPESTLFREVQEISFDQAFVEKNPKTSMTILDAGWSDLGSWTAIGALKKDLKGIIPYFGKPHDKQIRPWGFFQTLMENDLSKVKLLSVLPNEKLSLQKHQHRKENWHIISGIANVVREKEHFTLRSGDTIAIEKNQVHRLENIGSDSLEVIEIQTGSYFGEDDIIRIKDSYGRLDSN